MAFIRTLEEALGLVDAVVGVVARPGFFLYFSLANRHNSTNTTYMIWKRKTPTEWAAVNSCKPARDFAPRQCSWLGARSHFPRQMPAPRRISIPLVTLNNGLKLPRLDSAP